MTRQTTLAASVCLAACLLFLYPLPARAQTLPTLDHFDCYFSGRQPALSFPAGSLILRDVNPPPTSDDQGPEIETITGLTLIRLCSPVQKMLDDQTISIQHPFDHIAMYILFPPQPPLPPPGVVVISNQFAPQQVLQLFRPLILAVPTGKTLFSPLAGPPSAAPPIPTDLDHFKCYRAAGMPIGAFVRLHDQFDGDNTRSMLVAQPLLYCDAAVKRVTNAAGVVTTSAPPNPNQHLTCYHITFPPTAVGTTGFGTSESALIANQFTPSAGLTVNILEGAADILCSPSTVVPLPGLTGDSSQ